MRFGLAIASLVLAGILLILGIGQRTFLAGPSEIVYSLSLPTNAEFGVITAEQLTAVPGQANAVVTGDEAFAAVGADRDIAAWVAPETHAVFEADTKQRAFTGSAIAAEIDEPSAETPATADDSAADGSAAEDSAVDAADESEAAEGAEAGGLDPRGSDLWLIERDGAGRLSIALDEGQSLLVQAPNASNTVSIAWVQDQRTPLAGPLLVAGGLFAVLGLVLYLLAVDHDRRGLGPRRGKKGPLPGLRGWLARLGGGARRSAKNAATTTDRPDSDPQNSSGSVTAPGPAASSAHTTVVKRSGPRVLAVPALGLAAVLTLSGCSAEYWPEFSAPGSTEAPVEEATTAAPVPVTEAQIDRIVAEVAAVAAESDDALDAALLAERFTGDALAQRTANYTIRASVSDYTTPPRITDEQLDYTLVQSTEGWPRTIFVTVASESLAAPVESEDGAEPETTEPPAASPSLAMVLTQASPHENFQVSRVFALRGGISMPPAAPVEEGTALLADNLQTLALTPREVGDAYAEILVGSTDSEAAKLFNLEGDKLLAASGSAWVAAAQQTAAEGGFDVGYSVTAAQSSTPIVSLSTGVGGALVATTVLESRVEVQTGDAQPTAVGAFQALSGLSGRQQQITRVVAHQLLFFVPSEKNAESGEKIQLLGYTTEMVEAKN